jgi:hypothetical protein
MEKPNQQLAPDSIKFQSDVEPPQPTIGKSLTQEVELLRGQVQQLCQAVRQLVQLQSVANQKLDVALKGNADCAVL